MAFPINPSDGDRVGTFVYSASSGAWVQTSLDYKTAMIDRAEDSELISGSHYSNTTSTVVFYTVPANTITYLFHFVVASNTKDFPEITWRNSSNAIKHYIHWNRSYDIGSMECIADLRIPLKLESGDRLVKAGSGGYISMFFQAWERSI